MGSDEMANQGTRKRQTRQRKPKRNQQNYGQQPPYMQGYPPYNYNAYNQYNTGFQQPMNYQGVQPGQIGMGAMGGFLLNEAYRSATTKGHRRNMPVIGLIAATYGTFKLTKWASRKVGQGAKGAYRQARKVRERQLDKKYHDLTHKEYSQTSPTFTQESETVKTDSGIQYGGYDTVVPMSKRVHIRLNKEPGVQMAMQLVGKKSEEQKLKVGLGKQFIVLDDNGIYDQKGTMIGDGTLVGTSMELLNTYSPAYETGLLIILDEYIQANKLEY